jgi:hypothetical protein
VKDYFVEVRQWQVGLRPFALHHVTAGVVYEKIGHLKCYAASLVGEGYRFEVFFDANVPRTPFLLVENSNNVCVIFVSRLNNE